MIQELRIGNYVYDNFDVNNPNVITKISIDDFISMSHGNKYHPIPLTEDILLKCGLKKNEDNAYTPIEEIEDVFLELRIGNDGRIGLFFSLDDGVASCFDFIECTLPTAIPKYLHQLQNLYFALTGEELNVEL